jgi:hypothetical protein
MLSKQPVTGQVCWLVVQYCWGEADVTHSTVTGTGSMAFQGDRTSYE